MRQAWDWDPLLQCLYLDAPLLQQQNTKKLYGTKNNCACALGANSLEQILDAKGTKRPKTSASTSEEPRTKTGLWGAKQEDYAFPLHRPPKPPLQPNPWAHTYPHPMWGTRLLHLGEWESNFYWWRRPKTLVGDTQRFLCVLASYYHNKLYNKHSKDLSGLPQETFLSHSWTGV